MYGNVKSYSLRYTTYIVRSLLPRAPVQWFAVSTQLRFVDSYHMASSICLLRRFAPCSQGSWLNAAGFTE